MTRDSQRYERVEQSLSRRRALAGGVALLASGGALLTLGSDDVRAAVSLGELSIPDASLTGERVSPVVDVTINYEYDVGETAVGALRFGLTVGGDEIASAELVTDETRLAGSTDLAGPVTNSGQWASDAFAPAVASSVEHSLSVGLSFAVLNPDGTTIVSDSVSETVRVVVSHPQESQYIARVGASGEVRTATDN